MVQNLNFSFARLGPRQGLWWRKQRAWRRRTLASSSRSRHLKSCHQPTISIFQASGSYQDYFAAKMAALKAQVLDHFKKFLIASCLINSVLRRVVTRRFQIGKKRVVLVADSESLKFLNMNEAFTNFQDTWPRCWTWEGG